MNRISLILCVLGLCGLLNYPVSALSVSTPEQSLADNFAIAIQSYVDREGGKLPNQINDLSEYIDLQYIEATYSEPAENRISLLSSPISLSPDSKEEVVAITNNRIREDRRDSDGRYVIYKNDDGEIRSKWFNEKEIETVFKNANIKLPTRGVAEQPDVKLADPEYIATLPKDQQVSLIIEAIRSELDDKDEIEKATSAVLDAYGLEKTPTNQEIQSLLPNQTSRAINQPVTTKPETTSTTTKVEQKQVSFPWFWVGAAIVALGALVFLIIKLQKK